MKVPFHDLKAVNGGIASELDAAYQRVMKSGWFILGQEVEAFEAEFAAYCGVKYCIGVASGTEALQLGLLACGIGRGDEVISVAHTAMPTAMAIAATGATPVFVDIDPRTYTLDPEHLAGAITPKTRAILPVHLYGQCAGMDEIMAFAGQHDLYVVEDAAQAHGASYKGRKAGTMGHLGCFSFYPTKNLGACGDAGAVVTSDPELAVRLRRLRNYGQSKRYHHDTMGCNSRLDEMQAAVLRIKLPHLEVWNESRRRVAAHYRTRLDERFCAPRSKPDFVHNYHLFVIQSDDRDGLQKHLSTREIETLIHYPIPCHLQRAFRGIPHRCGDLSVTEWLAHRVLSLPVFPSLNAAQLAYVSMCVNSFEEAR